MSALRRGLFLAVNAVVFWTALPASGASLNAHAATAWERRAEPGQREEAIALWQKALAQNPRQPEVYVWLSKACGSAYRNSSDVKEKHHWADLALEYGRKAVAMDPQSSRAYAQYGEALGQYAQAYKGLQSLHFVKDAVAALQRAIALDPSNGYAHMLLSEFYAHAPSTISVGDKKRALEEAKLAVAADPAHTINHLALADAYKVNGDERNAIEELQRVLSLPAPADAVPETASDKRRARDILKSYGAAPASVADAGAPCTDSSQCESACVANPSPVPGASGSCAP